MTDVLMATDGTGKPEKLMYAVSMPPVPGQIEPINYPGCPVPCTASQTDWPKRFAVCMTTGQGPVRMQSGERVPFLHFSTSHAHSCLYLMTSVSQRDYTSFIIRIHQMSFKDIWLWGWVTWKQTNTATVLDTVMHSYDLVILPHEKAILGIWYIYVVCFLPILSLPHPDPILALNLMLLLCSQVKGIKKIKERKG